MLPDPVSEYPVKVSVLVAARNEEENIERCLHALALLDFPANELEILIGDDDSEDNTAGLTLRFCENNPRFKYHKITSQVAGLRGKANVLAQLAHLAKGEYFFYCDADIAVKPTWLGEMLRHFKPDTGTVVGLTRMKHKHFLGDLLSLEWLFALTITRLFSLLKFPVTGMGNNMAVTRKAYFAVGGYEKIGFSIVEDYALFMAIVRAGFGFKMAYNPKVLSVSEPVNTFPDLLRQRKRWMQGVMESHWITRSSLIVATMVVPALLLISIWLPIRPLDGILQYYALTTAISVIAVVKLKQYDLLKAAFFFWFYMVGIGLVMLVNYYVGGSLVWKGRKY